MRIKSFRLSVAIADVPASLRSVQKLKHSILIEVDC